MVDLNVEMAELWGSLGAPAAGRAHVVQFVSARRGEGTSTVAREFARFAARRAGRRTWLIDLDLTTSPQYQAIAAQPDRYGQLGSGAAASPDGSMFFTVQPPAPRPDGGVWPDSKYIAAHSVGGPRLWVTRFKREALRGRQKAHILPGVEYWAALRRHAEIIVVDCPSADSTQAALTIAQHMDQTILVVSAQEADVRPPGLLRDALASAGGRCAGVFFNQASVTPPSFLRAILP
ncbi:P-loop NTPase family protein [Caulobacter endophyticus]|uniref:Sugar kinase n=1 Tax=Caulobacter endophyticus TaxID=2172652 RepID=A0A2T9KCY2_9CAUL|nr:sugar kinase [Caulobacter endophyticus]